MVHRWTFVDEMRSQSSVLAHTTKSLSSLALTSNPTSNKEQRHLRSTTPVTPYFTLPACGTSIKASQQQSPQMTTGSGISGNGNNNVAAQQKPSSSCNTSMSTLSKGSAISSTTRHSNNSLSNNNNSSTAINNNKIICTNNNANNTGNSNEGNNNQNPNWTKLQTLEQRKLELEKLLNEKNWLLQQIHKQEAQILNGNYDNFNLFEAEKDATNNILTGGSSSSATTNSILRRKGSSSLKLNKSNVHFSGKNNRFTLSKSEYDLAQNNKLNNQPTTTNNQNVVSIKKRQGPPQKTNSFHDSTSTSALSLTKSPSFEYNGGTSSQNAANKNNHSLKYNVVRSLLGSTENLSNSLAVTQCDKYYLSPTSQMYADGSGFIKASQNIKQCLSPSPMHKVVPLNDRDSHRSKQQMLHSANGHNMVHHNGSQPHLEQYEGVDVLSLSPSTSCAFEQGQHMGNQHSNLWRTGSNNDRSAWCDSTSYVELDSDGGNPYKTKSLPKHCPSLQSPESPSLGNYYPVGGGMSVGNYPNTVEKPCDVVSISSVNSETSKKPKNKQWMESSLDGPIIRPNILQNTSCNDTIGLCPPQSVSQNSQYPYCNVARQVASSTASSVKLTPSPAASSGGVGNSLLVVSSRPPTRTLTHHSHPHHKQSYRERTKLSSQSMSSGSYRTPKTKLDDDNSHLSHSTSFLNVDPYHHHHFHIQPPPPQSQQSISNHHNNFHLEIPNSSTFTLPHMQQLQQQKPSKSIPLTASQQTNLPMFSPTIQQECIPTDNGDELIGTINYVTSVPSPYRLCNPRQIIANTKNNMPQNPTQMPISSNSICINPGQQVSPQGTNVVAAISPDIRIESPKNMTVVQQATFLPYKEVTKPFEMSDFYKYSTKFRQKEANTSTMSKNTT